ncbi:MAG: acyl-CoA thioesterase [Kiritimatiellae bacterium]|nr:acyl-CoA thioesterase [Kiritimatiellia bacterium]
MSDTLRNTISYRVPYADTDQMKVVYYANYLVYFERARNELLRALGLTYREMESMGFALPVREAHVNYSAPSTYDDLLEITAWCEELKGVRVKICCEIRRDGKLLADGYTVHVFVNLATMRPSKPSREILNALGAIG